MDEPSKKKRVKRVKRILGFVAVVAFVSFGFLFFGGRVPKELTLRFDVPPTVRGIAVEFPRAQVALVRASVIDSEGAVVASLDLPTPHGLEGPRTGPVALRLKRGIYRVRAEVKSITAQSVPLEGKLEVDGDESVVELATPR